MGWGEDIAAGVGFCILAIGVAEIGQRLRELIDDAFGAQMQAQFPPDDVQ